MTWLLVSTRPSELITMPVAAACSLWYCSAVLMMTRPGVTLLTMDCTFALPVLPLLGCGTAELGRGAGALADACGEAEALLLAGWYSATTEPAPRAPAASATST